MLDKKMLENIEKALLSTKTKTIKTGFQDLNYFLKGIDSSALITIGARPSMGKTALPRNYAGRASPERKPRPPSTACPRRRNTAAAWNKRKNYVANSCLIPER